MKQNQEPQITLTLPLGAVNMLLRGVAMLPFGEVAPLVQEVQQQAHSQLQAANAAAASASP